VPFESPFESIAAIGAGTDARRVVTILVFPQTAQRP
jgi:hypothetical protein